MATRRPSAPGRTPESAQPLETSAARRRAQRAKGAAPVTPPVTEPAAAAPAAPAITVSKEARRGMIAQAAYLRAEARGFAPGGEIEDWLAAETEVDALLRAGHTGLPQ
jgi:hypothetical protein